MSSDPNTVGQEYFIPSVYSKYNLKYKREVKYRNYNRTLTVALLGDYVKTYPNQNVSKSKSIKIFSSEVKTYPSGVKTYPMCSQNVPMIFV